MRFDEDKSKMVFSSGLERYACRGIIGIDEDLGVYQGSDGGFCGFEDPGLDTNPEDRPLTKAERQELAERMIALWRKFSEVD